ncbi:MAG TPA: hypothetical protein VKV69_06335 [Actinomycetota bacterium]|nr:hypothetical protein [Actinomycetota bacterium]
MTLGVGALGAFGSPKANGGTGRTSRGPSTSESPSPSPTPKESSVPNCEGRFESGGLGFDCPSGWFVWQNSHLNDDPYAETAVIISNHRPLEHGYGGLPDGWFKVDMYVGARDPHKTFEQLAAKACSSPDDATLKSCKAVTIAGLRWMQRIETDPFTQYRSISTVVDGVEVHLVAIIPDGAHAADGAREIDSLFASLSIH